jgi:hypothetical protein
VLERVVGGGRAELAAGQADSGAAGGGAAAREGADGVGGGYVRFGDLEHIARASDAATFDEEG